MSTRIQLDFAALKQAVNRDPAKKKEIATRLELGHSTMSRKLSGQRPVDAEELLTICDVLGIYNPRVFAKSQNNSLTQ